MNWIEKELEEKKLKQIDKKLEQINKDFFELGKEFYELKKENKLNYNIIAKKYLLSKNKINEYISNYKFIIENNIKNYSKLGIRKITLLKKIKDKEIIKILINKDNLTEEEIIKYIENAKERRIFKKTFNLTEIEKELFEEMKKKLEKELGDKITNSQFFSYILSYFSINYFNTDPEKD